MDDLRLKPEQLYLPCDPGKLGFRSTRDLPELTEVIGQERAVEAIRFGVGIKHIGYNLYALGPSRSGKRTVITRYLKQQAVDEARPLDWCYVFNFKEPHKPNAIPLPPGRAPRFERDMAQLVIDMGNAVPDALETDEYRARLQEIEQTQKQRQEEAFDKLGREAGEHGMAMLRTPTGFMFAPVDKKGEVVTPKDYENLSDREIEKIEQTAELLKERLEKLARQIPKWRREAQEQIRQLNQDVVMTSVGALIDELRREYAMLPEVLEYLGAVQQDVIEHADKFRRQEEPEGLASILPSLEMGPPFLNRYMVNAIVDNTKTEGAPVNYLDHPTYANLVGRVEHQAQLGALVTDFTMIKPGALHRANGGYLILDAVKLLSQPYAWDGIKRALLSKEIRIESLGQALSLISTTSLEPEPVPLNIKIVLLGDRLLYYLLCEYDPEFNELFKVAADFDDSIERSEQNLQGYARFIASIAQRDKLRPLEAGAVARLIEHGSRMVEDHRKMTSCFGKIADIVREADYWAGESGNKTVTREDVQKAINAHDYRMSRIHERLLESTLRHTLMIDTEGEAIGQINGLSVIELGDHAFGHPSRITASVRQGKGELVDIEREIEMGGPIHSKGVLILQGFLSGRYCPEQPLSLSASLVFEQTYGGVEGDSASSAELYALMSALAQAPIRQSLAVTGSVNQRGQVQAIGGVNEKIEGYFDICRERGLTGKQGVLIPSANVEHLMLRQEVVDAVASEQFHIYAVSTIDEGISLLTGETAGMRDDQGSYPEGSLNQRIEARLLAMAEQAHAKEQDADEAE